MNSVVALIVARNEEEHISKVISSLLNQSHKLENIVLVDDGSTDETPLIANKMGCTVISLPFHKESYVGNPALAKRWNVGLKLIRAFAPDYVLLLGGDHSLPDNYVEDLVNKMTNRIVVASGMILGEPYNEGAPRGSGRLINAKYWCKLNNMQYEVSYGWESWIILKTRKEGYETKCFREITSSIERPTRNKKTNSLGKGMYALGYHWKYALFRSAITALKSPNAGIKMFLGWLRPGNTKRLDVADYVNETQKTMFFNRFSEIIRNGGRR